MDDCFGAEAKKNITPIAIEITPLKVFMRSLPLPWDINPIMLDRSIKDTTA
jgi:hypothetical protein